jgi:hypothetical protein
MISEARIKYVLDGDVSVISQSPQKKLLTAGEI